MNTSNSRNEVLGSGASSGQEPSFESELTRLSQIVEALEKGEVPLDGSLALFEEGVKLARAAQDRLDRAQKRIEELVAVNADGTPRTIPFEP